MSNKRSPAYPRISLQRAISLVEMVYQGAANGAVDRETMVRLMGYKGLSGPSAAVLSALRLFGLIQGRDEAVQVTEFALRLLHPLTDEERKSALAQAFGKPDLYRAVMEKFGSNRPAEVAIMSFLVRQHGFKESGARAFVKNFYESYEFVVGEVGSADALVEEEAGVGAASVISPTSDSDANELEFFPSKMEYFPPQQRVVPSTNDVSVGAVQQSDNVAVSNERMSFRISDTASAEIRFSGEVTQYAIDKLIKFLELSKDSYSKELDRHSSLKAEPSDDDNQGE